jgi:hypothetical protein
VEGKLGEGTRTVGDDLCDMVIGAKITGDDTDISLSPEKKRKRLSKGQIQCK